MTGPSAFRFFWEILRPSRGTAAALCAMLAYATYLAMTSDEGFDNALALVLLTQLLAASTGYRDRLVRGHFDALLAGRQRREPVALVHAALSVLPGLALWLTFGALRHALASHASIGLTAGGLLAITYSSLMVWAVSLWLGKNTGGVLWMVCLFVTAGAGKVHALREAYRTVGADWFITARAAGAALAFPLAMLENGGYVEPPVLVLVCVATLTVFAAGVWTIVRLDAPLREPS